MSHRLITVLAIATATVVAGIQGPLHAGQRIPSTLDSAIRNRVGASQGERTTSVIAGQTLNADRSPVAFANVRLRNLSSGAIISQTSADHTGEFSFLIVSRGNYIAEVFDRDGVVLAVGDAMTVEAGQAVGTIIILPARLPSAAALFGNSAAAIVSAAAGAGITAVSATGEPLSPEE